MKPVLALAILALVALMVEETGRQVAGEAQYAYGEAAEHAHDATESLRGSIKQRPLVALLTAGAVGYVLTWFIPRRGGAR